MQSDEVTAICPVTGQPDLYVVAIEFEPDLFCLESKSLKLYLQTFRNEGIFAEALSATIAADAFKALAPFRLAVEVKQKSRGGVVIVARSQLVDALKVNP